MQDKRPMQLHMASSHSFMNVTNINTLHMHITYKVSNSLPCARFNDRIGTWQVGNQHNGVLVSEGTLCMWDGMCMFKRYRLCFRQNSVSIKGMVLAKIVLTKVFFLPSSSPLRVRFIFVPSLRMFHFPFPIREWFLAKIFPNKAFLPPSPLLKVGGISVHSKNLFRCPTHLTNTAHVKGMIMRNSPHQGYTLAEYCPH